MNSLTHKRCYKCGETKPIFEFHKDRNSPDGHQYKCKSCMSSRIRWLSWLEQKQNPGMKRCGRCRELKQLDQFHKDADKKDGFCTVCKNCKRAGAIKWFENNKQRATENVRLWQAGNPERVKKSRQKAYKKWCLVRRDDYLAHKRNRRVREKGNGGTITAQEWGDLKAKYNYTCLRCGKREPEIVLTLDHVKPLIIGGENVIENAQPLCGSCNSWKYTKWIDYR